MRLLLRLRDFPYDWSAAFWFAVAYLASAFSLYLVVFGWLIVVGGGRMTPAYAYIAPGLLGLVIFAVTSRRLVVSEPWRRFPTTMLTLYGLRLAASVVWGLIQALSHPGTVLAVLASLVGPATFGVVVVDSLWPFAPGLPDVWVPVGAAIGFALGRRRLRAEGRPFGPAADVHLEPLRLPKSADLLGTRSKR